MPGTSCTQRRGDGVTGGCVDGGFAPKSIKAEGNCVFFAEPNCGESATGQLDITSGGSPVCVQSSIMDQKVMSYTCVSANESQRSVCNCLEANYATSTKS
jgi:hypothetical protein